MDYQELLVFVIVATHGNRAECFKNFVLTKL